MDQDLARIIELFSLEGAAQTRYRELREGGGVAQPPTSADERLLALGLVERRHDGIVLAPVRLAVEHHVALIDQRVDAARRAATELDSALRSAQGPICEVLYGQSAVNRAFLELQLNARATVRSFDRGPYFHSSADEVLSPVQAEVSARGIAYSTIVEQRHLDDPELLAATRAGLELGESLRVIAELPLRLTIADDRLAWLVLPRPEGGDGAGAVDALVVYPSAFLDGLINMFESYWALAIPVDLGDPDVLGDGEDRRLLNLLATGMTDATIAAELGVSARTVQRRLNLLQHRHGAVNRFQLGALAVHRGLLDLGAVEHE
ncbi:helix-turn-helix transcriptional regulator [Microbacterium gorillae]|uniref:helix-turn-helix transcriptional regulator n=1 Tax=Microbacterium gorillae TaxID=1231063 RepID=UPI000693DF0C|nr:helix-turn-helix transcriptional regulator [Microbacterium gorillae]